MQTKFLNALFYWLTILIITVTIKTIITSQQPIQQLSQLSQTCITLPQLKLICYTCITRSSLQLNSFNSAQINSNAMFGYVTFQNQTLLECKQMIQLVDMKIFVDKERVQFINQNNAHVVLMNSKALTSRTMTNTVVLSPQHQQILIMQNKNSGSSNQLTINFVSQLVYSQFLVMMKILLITCLAFSIILCIVSYFKNKQISFSLLTLVSLHIIYIVLLFYHEPYSYQLSSFRWIIAIFLLTIFCNQSQKYLLSASLLLLFLFKNQFYLLTIQFAYIVVYFYLRKGSIWKQRSIIQMSSMMSIWICLAFFNHLLISDYVVTLRIFQTNVITFSPILIQYLSLNRNIIRKKERIIKKYLPKFQQQMHNLNQFTA